MEIGIVSKHRSKTMTKKKKLLVAAALAGILVGASSCANKSVSPETVGECHGINSCKGTGACGGDGHVCAGQNACKGKGWLKLTKGKCDAKGGTFKTHGS